MVRSDWLSYYWAICYIFKAPYSSEKRQLLGGKKGLKSSFN